MRRELLELTLTHGELLIPTPPRVEIVVVDGTLRLQLKMFQDVPCNGYLVLCKVFWSADYSSDNTSSLFDEYVTSLYLNNEECESVESILASKRQGITSRSCRPTLRAETYEINFLALHSFDNNGRHTPVFRLTFKLRAKETASDFLRFRCL